ncbi:hypothetical protein AVEN_221682-1 [Araneus ventricosus]|uniref:Uncharacterized protein n=1 Tax=Araneus ventricosus TaxID=182803 RepID=A0A4Y1ZVD2_ARAVE|nr:hypothetical protein AVEN_10108-1 [Araneus ventricosus]GBL68999.1 hypothetical protein AVEN_221682-1 [Araneus ventricosus]
MLIVRTEFHILIGIPSPSIATASKYPSPLSIGPIFHFLWAIIPGHIGIQLSIAHLAEWWTVGHIGFVYELLERENMAGIYFPGCLPDFSFFKHVGILWVEAILQVCIDRRKKTNIDRKICMSAGQN